MFPKRGFSVEEFRTRTRNAQTLMREAGLAALLLTTEPEIRYYTGFLTRFWESPTRPWFLVIRESGDPIAVIPSIGAHLMSQSWISDIRCWGAPDYADDGVGLLAETLTEVTAGDAMIGVADQMESHLRMPLQSFEQLRCEIGGRRLTGDHAITRHLRLIKSDTEIDKIRVAARIADRAFDRVQEIAEAEVSLAEVFRRFQILCLEEGADWVPYLAGAAGALGYCDVISPATEAPISPGDVLMLDTGLVWDGYFCDFDRNYSIGPPSPAVQAAHARLVEACHAAAEIARPGVRASDLFHAMEAIVKAGPGSGRLGHGLGMQLTEWPSLIAEDHTVLAPGMVLTLEPLAATQDGKFLVHEENIVIRETGAEYLSTPQPSEIRVI